MHFKWDKLSTIIYMTYLKFIYSEKATKFCEIFTLLLSYVVTVKSKVKISQNFVAFSEYMSFTKTEDVNLMKENLFIICNIRMLAYGWFSEPNLIFKRLCCITPPPSPKGEQRKAAIKSRDIFTADYFAAVLCNWLHVQPCARSSVFCLEHWSIKTS